ncbi:hypothetical protein GCM10027413_10910 [Conyzicola nivalis]|uniref:SnoaL-like domain-containing protein n=1 Tax=Conyzicola nivalis TaxID=1477021 RepID=A0A916SKI3_9MICO|nr:nuclear transport factor 2 family protein [Conyzicola nivalis]GGB01974.1 hypothetical protein GCM10010979_15720 [Conyzicola nivalis]
MSTAESLMRANLLEVFAERDPQRRTTAIARTYTDDVVFTDPDDSAIGHDAIHRKAQEVLDGAPDFVFRAGGPVYEAGDLAYLAWEFGPEGQPAVVSGVDVGFVEGERLAKVYTLLLR